MKVNIVTIAYNLPRSTEKLFETAMLDSGRHDISFQLFLHSKDPDTVVMCEKLAAQYPTIYYQYGTNRGLANSWNEGILAAYGDLGADLVLIANDDVAFSEGDVDKLVTRAISHSENYMVSCAGYNAGLGRDIPSLGYSCFILNPIGFDMLGMFDQNLFPIYCEDIDHHRRAHLSDLVEANCSDTKVFHGGSSAIKANPILARQNMVTQTKNREYIRRKWGSEVLEGGFKTPFNNKRFGLKIEPEDRFEPYPGYNRTDQYIVRF